MVKVSVRKGQHIFIFKHDHDNAEQTFEMNITFTVARRLHSVLQDSRDKQFPKQEIKNTDGHISIASASHYFSP